ncbi:hypothetical protein DFS34DRAFT_268651 [Phlyctochytrium arcticum]|nr:hypothetical protein DFS34DRAFT_268651 [Phlyctochytrium arcticum]
MSRSFVVQYAEMRRYLAEYLRAQGSDIGRNNAKEKLARLSERQYGELSTDVYDEIKRREINSAPFLAVRTDFTQKRNQARQKLATLPDFRFQELAAEVFYEMGRRMPEVAQEVDGGAGRQNTSAGRTLGRERSPVSPPRAAFPPPPSYPAPNGLPGPRSTSPGREKGLPKTPTGNSRAEVAGAVNDFMRKPRDRSPGSSTTPNGRIVPTRGASRGAAPRITDRSMDRDRTELPGMRVERARIAREERQAREALGGAERNRLEPSRMDSGASVTSDNTRDLERVRTKYEAEITSLKVQLKRETDAANEAMKMAEDLERERKAKKEVTRKYDDLLTDYATLQEELKLRDETIEKMRSEVKDGSSELLQDIQLLSAKNQKLQEEKDKDSDIIRQLRSEIDRLKSETTSEPSTPRTRNDSAKGDLFFGADGENEDPKFMAFQDAAERFIRAANGTNPTEVVVTMKSVVLTVKRITEDASRLESQAQSSKDYAALEAERERVSDELADLVIIAKQHAASYNKDDVNVVEDGIRRVDQSVRALLQVMEQVEKRADKSGNSATLGRSLKRKSDDSIRDDPRAPRDSVNVTPLEVVDLKMYIEEETDNIVALITDLLGHLRAGKVASSLTCVENIQGTISNIVAETRLTQPQLDLDTRDEVDVIITLMEAAAEELANLGSDLKSDDRNKSIKQRIGTTSYEVAKHVKALLSLFE